MRPIALASALLVALLVSAAPLALAGGETHSEKGRLKAEDAKARHADAANATDGERSRGRGNATHDDGAGKEQGEARKGLLEGLRARLQALREALRLDQASVREACHGAEPDHRNATREESRAWGHCIRDGYHKLFDAFRLERGAIKDEMKAIRA